MTLAGNRVRPFFCSAAPQAHSSVPAINLAAAARRGGQGWPHLRPPQGLALTGPSTVARRQLRLRLSGAGDLVAKRDASAASVTGLPMLSCRIEAPARPLLAAALSIATRIVRSFAPPGRQSAS